MFRDRELPQQALKRFWSRNDPGGLRPDWVRKIRDILSALANPKARRSLIFRLLDSTLSRPTTPADMRYGCPAIWRLTFGWRGDNAVEIDLEDYHGD